MKNLGGILKAATEGLIPAIMATPAIRRCYNEDEIKELREGCKQSMGDANIHGYMTMYFWCGQKPLVEDEGVDVVS